MSLYPALSRTFALSPLFAALLAGQVLAAPTLEGCPVFPADNIWNVPVDTAPVHSRSDAYIASIGTGRTVHPDFGAGLWNGAPIGIPFVTVSGSQPKVPIVIDDYPEESDPGPFPIPPNAPIEGGPNSSGDRHVLVVDRDNCKLYEMYSSRPQANGSWIASSTAVFDLRSQALRPDGWTSTDAAGLPVLSGLARYDEVAAGEIAHALRFTTNITQRAYLWPARHFASSNRDLNVPPMGLRVRLKASVDENQFTGHARVIVRALKKYGMILADNGSPWYISGAPDNRWNDSELRQLGRLRGDMFEAVDVSGLQISANSGQARVGSTPPPPPPPAPSCTLAASPAQITTGQQSTFTATCTNSPSGYVWGNLNNGPAASGNPARLTFTTAGTFCYTVAGTNAGGQGPASAQACVTVTNPPPPPPPSPPSCTLAADRTSLSTGQTATLTATCTNSPTSYTWANPNNGPQPSGRIAALQFPNAGRFCYTVAGTNAAGTGAASNNVCLDVAATPPPPPPPPGPGPSISGCPAFPADNIWNAAVDQLPVHPRSADYIASIGTSRAIHPDFGAGLWNGAPFGIPYVTVPGTQAPVPIRFTDWPGESDPGPYPVPANAPVEGGPNATGDRHVIVVDKDRCKLYELYNAWPESGGGWRASNGAVFDLRSNALRPRGWTSADAAGLPIVTGLARFEEMAAGEIRHALRFTAPRTQRAYVWPARHFASNDRNTALPPMGLRVRLKASVDESRFSPEIRVFIRALKRYGMILADNGSAWYISGTQDNRWNNDRLRELARLRGSDFEAVDASSLQVSADSGQVKAPTSTTTTKAIEPATGWWWNPAEPGRGFMIEKQDQKVFFAAYTYAEGGHSKWYAAWCDQSTASETEWACHGDLLEFRNGQSLLGVYRGAQRHGAEIGKLNLRFTAPDRGTLSWPGGTVPLQRFTFGDKNAVAKAAGGDSAGWWWNPSEAGRGWSFEVSGNRMFFAGYMYREGSGEPVWYVGNLQRDATDGDTFTGKLAEYGNGQPMSGSHRAPTVVNGDVAEVKVQLLNQGEATLEVNGRTLPLTRFKF